MGQMEKGVFFRLKKSFINGFMRSEQNIDSKILFLKKNLNKNNRAIRFFKPKQQSNIF